MLRPYPYCKEFHCQCNVENSLNASEDYEKQKQYKFDSLKEHFPTNKKEMEDIHFREHPSNTHFTIKKEVQDQYEYPGGVLSKFNSGIKQLQYQYTFNNLQEQFTNTRQHFGQDLSKTYFGIEREAPQDQYEFDNLKKHLEKNKKVMEDTYHYFGEDPNKINSLTHSGIKTQEDFYELDSLKQYSARENNYGNYGNISLGTHFGIKTEVLQNQYEFDNLMEHFEKNKQVMKDVYDYSEQDTGKLWELLTNNIKHRENRPNWKHIVEIQCEYCEKKFDGKTMEKHLIIHRGDETCECEKCGRKFKESNLKKHMRIHSGKSSRYIECEYCGMGFNEYCKLKRHVRIHTGEKPFICEQCGKNFTQKCSLTSHLRIHTGEMPYECKHCAKKMRHLGRLRSHLLTHTEEKRHECEQCGKRFKETSHLKRHMTIHTEEKPFECQQCGNKFKRNAGLRKHLKTHMPTRERPYECEHCGKKFINRTNLKAHSRTHTGERPFECKICGKKFRHYSNLSTHKMIHSEERKYECDNCGKKFKYSNNLTVHMKIHLRETKTNK